jgi:LysR family transcriptional regulator, nod-box dependent transcriptional activator
MSINLTRFDLNLLVVLDALLTEKSVTRAAERLFVSQPAVSNSLNRLRVIFNDPLLVRSGRQMDLSPHAHTLVGPAHDALLKVRELLETKQEFVAAISERTFRIAMSDYCTVTILPLILRRLAVEAPGVKLVVDPWSKDRLIELETGDLDLCMTLDERRTISTPRHPELLREVQLYTDNFVCVVESDHPLRHEMDQEDYLRFKHVVVGFGTAVVTVDRMMLMEAGIETEAHHEVPSFSTVLFQLKGTQFIGIVPELLARIYLPILGLRILPLPAPIPALKEVLLWHARSDNDHGHSWLRDLIQFVGKSLYIES